MKLQPAVNGKTVKALCISILAGQRTVGYLEAKKIPNIFHAIKKTNMLQKEQRKVLLMVRNG